MVKKPQISKILKSYPSSSEYIHFLAYLFTTLLYIISEERRIDILRFDNQTHKSNMIFHKILHSTLFWILFKHTEKYIS